MAAHLPTKAVHLMKELPTMRRSSACLRYVALLLCMLGTGTVAAYKRKYKPFTKARAFVRSLGLKNRAEWRQYCNGGLAGYEPKPDDIPANPAKKYRDQGWVSFGDWLGTGTISNNLRQYRPFEEARTFARSLGLKSGVEWKQYGQGVLAGYEPKPVDIPAKPIKVYRDQGWVSMGDWLGNS